MTKNKKKSITDSISAVTQTSATILNKVFCMKKDILMFVRVEMFSISFRI